MIASIKSFAKKTTDEHSIIADNVFATIASMPQPRTKAHVVKACLEWASEQSILAAIDRLVNVGHVRSKRNCGADYGLRREVKLYFVSPGIPIPELRPVEAIETGRRNFADSCHKRIRQHVLRLAADQVYPSQARVMQDLRLPYGIVQSLLPKIVEDLVIDEVIDDSEASEEYIQSGLGERARDRVERRTAIVLAGRLGMRRPPRDWRAWYEQVAERRRTELGLGEAG